MKTFVIGDVHGRRAQLRRLLEIVPRDAATDTLVLLGDLIDRGDDVPGVVADVIELQREAQSKNLAAVVCLRGNHEQMLLDAVDDKSLLWLHGATGSETTFEQYAKRDLSVMLAEDADEIQSVLASALPPAHLDFFRRLPFFYEDEHAIYVHAGLKNGQHPRETNPHQLLWARDEQFFKHYHGKLCIFGHTPVPLLPLIGRIGRHGIYISHRAVGIDTGYTLNCPLTCLELPSFTIYQTFADGRTAQHHLTLFAPKSPRAPHGKEKSEAWNLRSEIKDN